MEFTRDELLYLKRELGHGLSVPVGQLNTAVSVGEKLTEALEKLEKPITLQVRADQLQTLLDALAVRYNECPAHILPQVAELVDYLHPILRKAHKYNV
jgi:hypothetical protein